MITVTDYVDYIVTGNEGIKLLKLLDYSIKEEVVKQLMNNIREQKYSTYIRVKDFYGTTDTTTVCSICIRIPSSSPEMELWVEIHYHIAYSKLCKSVDRFSFSVYVNVHKKVKFIDYRETHFAITICNDKWARMNNPLEAIALYMQVSKEDLDKSEVVKDVVDRDMIQTFIIETFNKLEQSLLQETS